MAYDVNQHHCRTEPMAGSKGAIMHDEKIEVVLRVKSCVIKPWQYNRLDPPGECLEIKAEGGWVPTADVVTGPGGELPVSLHITVYPGCGVVPVIGDCVQITVERLAGQRAERAIHDYESITGESSTWSIGAK
jgi:hypothetical protein